MNALEKTAFDKISCVGMSEHVGKANMRLFFQMAYEALKPGGLFLQHTITAKHQPKKGHANLFLNTYMFPGGQLLPEQDLIETAAFCGFELLNAENFRPHYVKTLAHWIGKMEKNKEKILDLVQEHTYRIYHIFFIGSLVSFQHQNLFYKPRSSQVEMHYFSTPFLNNER
ncbi:MAG: class I SAM-dependent methyltransferase [Desulfobacter sp.]|nr:MAG: class I SAM-dependent methyltransferase [Desulfobacter sp.]